MNNKLVKVNCEDEDGYRKMVSALKENKVPYYTYENKQTRPLRVVAKGLHNTWSEKEIYDDLLAKGYKIDHDEETLDYELEKLVLDIQSAAWENTPEIVKKPTALYQVFAFEKVKGKVTPSSSSNNSTNLTSSSSHKRSADDNLDTFPYKRFADNSVDTSYKRSADDSPDTSTYKRSAEDSVDTSYKRSADNSPDTSCKRSADDSPDTSTFKRSADDSPDTASDSSDSEVGRTSPDNT
ncbi:hypothetical protein WDU94_005510 [Cyamophila willieti]